MPSWRQFAPAALCRPCTAAPPTILRSTSGKESVTGLVPFSRAAAPTESPIVAPQMALRAPRLEAALEHEGSIGPSSSLGGLPDSGDRSPCATFM